MALYLQHRNPGGGHTWLEQIVGGFTATSIIRIDFAIKMCRDCILTTEDETQRAHVLRILSLPVDPDSCQ